MPTFNVATFFTQRITVACLHFGLLAALLLGVASARAEAPQATAQVPGYYHMTLGKFQVTALYDGPIALHTKLLKNVPAQDMQRLLARLFVKGPEVQTAVNAYVVNTGERLILVDAGAAKLFGPTLGHIVDNLRAAGYQPEQVDTILITHLHGDHINGLVTPEGQRVFPKAVIWSAQADNDFWLSETVAAQAPQAVVATRLNVLKAIELGQAAAVADFIPVQQRLANSEDAAEGVRSFIEKRPARFTGR